MSSVRALVCLFYLPYLPFLGHITVFLKRQSDGKYLHLDRWGLAPAKWVAKKPADLRCADSRFDFVLVADLCQLVSEWRRYTATVNQRMDTAICLPVEGCRQFLFDNCAKATERFLARYAGVRMLPSAIRLPMDVFRAARSQIKTHLGPYNHCKQQVLAHARQYDRESGEELELSALRCESLLPMLRYLDALRLYGFNYGVYTNKDNPTAAGVVKSMVNLAKSCVTDHSYGSLSEYQNKFRLCMQTLVIDKTKLHRVEKVVKIIVNVLLAIALCGILYLVAIGFNKCVTGHWLLFGKPHGQGLKEKILRSIDALAPVGSNP